MSAGMVTCVPSSPTSTSTPSTRGCATPRRFPRPHSPRSETSAPALNRWSAPGRDVVSVHLASGLSGTFESASEAARIMAESGYPGRVEVVDGQTGAGGLGCLVLTAARAAEPGAESPSSRRRCARPASGSRSGFASTPSSTCAAAVGSELPQAMLGSALKVKPILTFGSEIAPVGRVRTRRRALERMEDYLRELHDRGAKRLGGAARSAARGRRASRGARAGHLRDGAALLHTGGARAWRPPWLRSAGGRDHG